MTQLPNSMPGQISIKDWLKRSGRLMGDSAAVRAVRRLPIAVRLGVAAFTGITFSLMVISFAIGNVVAHQGYDKIAFATPVATGGRTIRQAEVAHFGTRVSDAFGINHSVATEFADWILEASERQGLTPELLASLVVTESSFRKQARSHVGAVGPTQVRPDFWANFCGASDLTDPEQNVYCGAQVLSHLLDRCDGDRDCALAAYNTGPYSSRKNAAERYVKKVDRYLSTLHTQGAL